VPEHVRRTLISERTGEAAYAFDIRLQGDNETVFFET
jgi:protocatechuate 3,4-dioxygenase beta subunit